MNFKLKIVTHQSLSEYTLENGGMESPKLARRDFQKEETNIINLNTVY